MKSLANKNLNVHRICNATSSPTCTRTRT